MRVLLGSGISALLGHRAQASELTFSEPNRNSNGQLYRRPEHLGRLLSGATREARRGASLSPRTQRKNRKKDLRVLLCVPSCPSCSLEATELLSFVQNQREFLMLEDQLLSQHLGQVIGEKPLGSLCSLLAPSPCSLLCFK